MPESSSHRSTSVSSSTSSKYENPGSSSPTYTPANARDKFSRISPLVEGEMDLEPESWMSDPSKYKLYMCPKIQANRTCDYGHTCRFAHRSSELGLPILPFKYKSKLCSAFHKEGYCAHGSKCEFIHTHAVKANSKLTI